MSRRSHRVWIRAAAVTLAASGLVAGTITTQASAATATTSISTSPLKFDTTNGDILAVNILVLASGRYLAFSGNFSTVKTEDGVSHAAANLAVVSESTGALVYAATSTNSAGYIRALANYNGILYAGGNFTKYNGESRNHLVAINTANWTVTSWNPGATSIVRAVAANASGVYYGGDLSTVREVSASTGATVWSDSVTNGSVHVLLLNPATGGLYVGGYFDSVGGFANHGLVEVNATTGTPITTFAPALAKNDGIGSTGSYDGENPMSLALDTAVSPTRLLMGSGGIQNYVRFLNSTTGANSWVHGTPGDAQAVAVVGNTTVVGYHRNRPNSGSFQWPYFSGQLLASNGALTSWAPGLSGTQGDADGGNNGIQAMVFDPVSNTLYLAGAFLDYGATCNPATTIACSGGTPLKSLAAYSVSNS